MSHTSRQRTLLRYYGITEDEYDSILQVQGGRCAICGQPPSAIRRLSVDHDHKTGITRGLLCYMCNRLLGFVRDNKDILIGAANYLTNPPAISILGREAKGTVERKRRRKKKTEKLEITDQESAVFLTVPAKRILMEWQQPHETFSQTIIRVAKEIE